MIVIHSSSSSSSGADPSSNLMRMPLEHLVSRLGGAAGGSSSIPQRGNLDSYLSVDPSDATSAVASGVITALTSVNPAPPVVSMTPGGSGTSSIGHHDAAGKASSWVSSSSRASTHSSGTSSSNLVVDYTWAVGHHPFPPFGLLSQSTSGNSGDAGGSSQGGANAGAASSMKGRGSSGRGSSTSSSTSTTSSCNKNNAPLWTLSPLYGDGATRSAIAANVHAAREVIIALSHTFSPLRFFM